MIIPRDDRQLCGDGSASWLCPTTCAPTLVCISVADVGLSQELVQICGRPEQSPLIYVDLDGLVEVGEAGQLGGEVLALSPHGVSQPQVVWTLHPRLTWTGTHQHQEGSLLCHIERDRDRERPRNREREREKEREPEIDNTLLTPQGRLHCYSRVSTTLIYLALYEHHLYTNSAQM